MFFFENETKLIKIVPKNVWKFIIGFWNCFFLSLRVIDADTKIKIKVKVLEQTFQSTCGSHYKLLSLGRRHFIEAIGLKHCLEIEIILRPKDSRFDPDLGYPKTFYNYLKRS